MRAWNLSKVSQLKSTSLFFHFHNIFNYLYILSIEIISFDETISNLIETLETQATKIEQVKLRVDFKFKYKQKIISFNSIKKGIG